MSNDTDIKIDIYIDIDIYMDTEIYIDSLEEAHDLIT